MGIRAGICSKKSIHFILREATFQIEVMPGIEIIKGRIALKIPSLMKNFQKLILICLFFYLPLSGNAWGLTGHRVVGEIADSYLNKKNQKRNSKKSFGFESVAMASNWPDFIKSNPVL